MFPSVGVIFVGVASFVSDLVVSLRDCSTSAFLLLKTLSEKSLRHLLKSAASIKFLLYALKYLSTSFCSSLVNSILVSLPTPIFETLPTVAIGSPSDAKSICWLSVSPNSMFFNSLFFASTSPPTPTLPALVAIILFISPVLSENIAFSLSDNGSRFFTLLAISFSLSSETIPLSIKSLYSSFFI